MGSRNVSWAIGTSASVSDSAYRVLVFMAWHTLDTPRGKMPANVYARGWRFAAEILYPDLEPDTAKRRIARAVAELVSKGKLKPLGHGGRGRRQLYELMP